MRACGPYGPRGFESLSRRQPIEVTAKKQDEDENGLRKSGIVALVIVFLALASSVPLSFQAAPTLQASSDPSTASLYTLRDKQVPLIGSGYTANKEYYIWTMGPTRNYTHYSGASFTALSTGLIPPGVAVPISTNATLGTYLISVSTSSTADTSQATAHFGLWGTLKPIYQRTQLVMIMGGGLFPGVSAKLSIRNPAGDYVKTATAASDAKGHFNYTWRIPEDAVTETYKIFVDGTGTFDNAQQNYLSDSSFTVTPAVLSVKVTQSPDPSYQRSDKAKVSFGLTYPDGSPVLKSNADIRPLNLMQNQTTVAAVALSLADPSNGIWTGEAKILTNATLSSRYRFALPAMSFDDGYGNKGGGADTFSAYFEVRAANLTIASEVNGTQIQVPFGQVSIISKITYPDGTPLTNGTVTTFVSTDSSASGIKLTYDPSIGAWRGSYSSAFWDLWRVGEWTLRLQATDAFGNSGTTTSRVAAQPYLFLVLVAVLVAAVLFSRWTLARYGRKLYFRVRKALQRLRSLSTAKQRQ
jgi:hypothetical protein